MAYTDLAEPRCWCCGKFCAIEDLVVRREWDTGDVADQYHRDEKKCTPNGERHKPEEKAK